MKRLLKAVAVLVCTFALAVPAFPTTGFTPVAASNIIDASGFKLASGRVTFFPVNNLGKPISAIAGGAGGMITQTGVVFLVVNGAITTDTHGNTPQVADTALTTPAHICYRISVTDSTGAQIQGPGYGLQQPTGSSAFNLDTAIPNQPTQATIQTGPQGPTGPPGTPVVWRGTWSSATTYAANDSVFYGGSSYVSLLGSNLNQNPSTATTYWSLLVTGGEIGATGPPTTFLGAYSSGTTYATGQAVSYGGSSYVSLVASNTGNTPSSSPTQWGLLAAQGATGMAGGGETAQQLGDVTTHLQVLANVFKVSTANTGTCLNGDGTLNTSCGGYWTSDYIATTPGQVVTANSTVDNVCYYSQVGAVVSCNMSVSTASLTTPAGVTLMKVTHGSPITAFMLVYGSTIPGSYVSGDVLDKATTLADIAAATGTGVTTQQLGDTATHGQLLSNVFKVSKANCGGITLNSDGSISGTPAACTTYGSGWYWWTSDYIATTPGQLVTTSTTVANVCYYSQVGAMVSCNMSVSTPALTTPAGATLMRVTENASPWSFAAVYGSTFPSPYQSGDVLDAATALADIAVAPTPAVIAAAINRTLQVSNLLRDRGSLPNTGLDGGTHLPTTFTGWTLSDFIPAVAGATYTVSSNNSNGSSVDTFGPTGNWMGAVSLGSCCSTATFTIPAGVFYIRLTYAAGTGAGSYDGTTLVAGSTALTPYVSGEIYDQTTVNNLLTTNAANRPFLGAHALLISDSLSDMLVQAIADLGASATVEYLYPGEQTVNAFQPLQTIYAANPTGPTVVQQLTTVLESNSISLIVVGGGSNEYGVTTGSFGDAPYNPGTTTPGSGLTSTDAYSSWEYVAQTVEAAVAAAEASTGHSITVIWVGAYQQYRYGTTYTTTQAQIHTGLTQVLGQWGIPFIPLDTAFPINSFTWSQYVALDTDGHSYIHPNSFGIATLGAYLAHQINTLAQQ